MRFTWPLSLSLALAANLPQVEAAVPAEMAVLGKKSMAFWAIHSGSELQK